MVSGAMADQAWVALSKVDGLKGEKGRVALFRVKESLAQLPLEFRGPGAGAFSVSSAEKGENSLLMLEIAFAPPETRGFYSAELVVGGEGETQVIQIRGIATQALEGENEPTLHEVFAALGADANAGGTTLQLDTKKKTIGDSIAASQFEPVKGESVKVTPLARFSPAGEAPFGLSVGKGQSLQFQALGGLSATTKARPDAHQTLRPPMTGGLPVIEIPTAPEKFGLFFKGGAYTSITMPGQSAGAPIENTARIYPVTQLAGRAITNGYLVCFEEAANGDYQDAVFLIEGVKAVK